MPTTTASAAAASLGTVTFMPALAQPKRPHPSDVGERAEAHALAVLGDLGYLVSVPWGSNQRYDLVVDDGDRLFKVQVKAGRILDGTIEFNAYSVDPATKKCRAYDGEIDAFVVYCAATGGTYWVPIDECGKTKMRLRLQPTRNGQTRGVRWAKDYELPSSPPDP